MIEVTPTPEGLEVSVRTDRDGGAPPSLLVARALFDDDYLSHILISAHYLQQFS